MTLGFDDLYAGAGEVLAGRDMDGLAIADVEVVATSGDSLRLAFPLIGPESGIEVLRLDFTTALFAAGAVLQASLQNSTSEEWDWQRVDPGDAVRGSDQQHHDLEGRSAEPIIVGGRGNTRGPHSKWRWGQRSGIVPLQR